MNLKNFLLPGMVTLGFCSISIVPANAQTPSTPIPDSNAPLNLRLNRNQQEAFRKLSGFAFDQFEILLSSEFDPETLKRQAGNQEVEQMMRQLPELLRPDRQQTSELRNLIRSIRQQVGKELDRN